MVVVGPEEPLVRGITDHLLAQPGLENLMVCGPGAEGARLEGSKAYAKAFMSEFGIPTARYGEFNSGQTDEAIHFLDNFNPPYVIKADGLAAGKGVVISPDKAEAAQTIRDMFSGSFGQAGETVVIEEFLDGIEFSVFALTDGQHWVLLPEAKDYKRIGDGDTGPNTGGMGAVSPVPFADADLMEKVASRIVSPTVRGLASRQIPYKGFLFFGLIRVDEEPYVIEYNCRMGDPETEVVLPRMASDLMSWIIAMHEERLGDMTLDTDPRTAVTVMLVSGGYPGSYAKGLPVKEGNGLFPPGCRIFHAGTALKDGDLVTNGGRVMACTATGEDLASARAAAYALAGTVRFDGMHYRKDIGADL